VSRIDEPNKLLYSKKRQTEEAFRKFSERSAKASMRVVAVGKSVAAGTMEP